MRQAVAKHFPAQAARPLSPDQVSMPSCLPMARLSTAKKVSLALGCAQPQNNGMVRACPAHCQGGLCKFKKPFMITNVWMFSPENLSFPCTFLQSPCKGKPTAAQTYNILATSSPMLIGGPLSVSTSLPSFSALVRGFLAPLLSCREQRLWRTAPAALNNCPRNSKILCLLCPAMQASPSSVMSTLASWMLGNQWMLTCAICVLPMTKDSMGIALRRYFTATSVPSSILP